MNHRPTHTSVLESDVLLWLDSSSQPVTSAELNLNLWPIIKSGAGSLRSHHLKLHCRSPILHMVPHGETTRALLKGRVPNSHNGTSYCEAGCSKHAPFTTQSLHRQECDGLRSEPGGHPMKLLDSCVQRHIVRSRTRDHLLRKEVL